MKTVKASELVVDENLAGLYDANQLFVGYGHFQNVFRGLKMMEKYRDVSEEARVLFTVFKETLPDFIEEGIGININNAGEMILNNLNKLDTLTAKEIARYYSLSVSWVFERAVPVSISGGLFDIEFMKMWCKKVGMCNENSIEKLVEYSQSNRDFLYNLGNRTWGLTPENTRIVLLEAARMGCPRSMFRYAQNVFLATDPEFYKWMDISFRRYTASEGLLKVVLEDCFSKVDYVLTSGPVVKYYAGKFIHNVNPERFKVENEVALSLKILYLEWTTKARAAVDTWTLMGRCRRLTHKDIVRVISRMIWEYRSCWGDVFYEEKKIEMMKKRRL